MPTTVLWARLGSALAAVVLSLSFACGGPAPVVEGPPYQGTAYIDPDLIVASDPSALRSLDYAGRGVRTMFDRRLDAFVAVDAYLFEAGFEGGAVVEVQVNQEFGDVGDAERHAAFYARDHPRREDVAESFGPFFALRHRQERISRSMTRTIEATMPNRIEYFDRLDVDMHPVR